MTVALVRCILPVITGSFLLVAYVLYSEVVGFQRQIRLRQFDRANCPVGDDLTNFSEVSCDGVINLDSEAICAALRYKRNLSVKPESIDCDQLTSHYCMKRVKNDENFPIAFIITIHDDFEQFEQLLRLIYHPDNYYCVNVDLKAKKIAEQVANLSNCFPNVLIPPQFVDIYWGGYGQLKSQLNCLSILSNSSLHWNYLVNLAGSDFPLKTNSEIIAYLRSLNGLSHAEIEFEIRTKRYKFEHKKLYGADGIPYDHKITSVLKSPPPVNLTIYKGNVAALLSRDFTTWLQQSQVAINFSRWLENTDKPDEHYWASMLVLKEKLELRPQFIPGLDGKREKLIGPYMARWAVWRPNFCGGKFIRDVCVFGVLDLPGLINRPELFANKFHTDFQPAAKLCLQQRLLARRSNECR